MAKSIRQNVRKLARRESSLKAGALAGLTGGAKENDRYGDAAPDKRMLTSVESSELTESPSASEEDGLPRKSKKSRAKAGGVPLIATKSSKYLDDPEHAGASRGSPSPIDSPGSLGPPPKDQSALTLHKMLGDYPSTVQREGSPAHTIGDPTGKRGVPASSKGSRNIRALGAEGDTVMQKASSPSLHSRKPVLTHRAS